MQKLRAKSRIAEVVVRSTRRRRRRNCRKRTRSRVLLLRCLLREAKAPLLARTTRLLHHPCAGSRARAGRRARYSKRQRLEGTGGLKRAPPYPCSHYEPARGSGNGSPAGSSAQATCWLQGTGGGQNWLRCALRMYGLMSNRQSDGAPPLDLLKLHHPSPLTLCDSAWTWHIVKSLRFTKVLK